MTLQDDIDTIYKLDAAQNIEGRLYQKNTFGLWSDANKAYIKAAPLMVSTIRRLGAELEAANQKIMDMGLLLTKYHIDDNIDVFKRLGDK